LLLNGADSTVSFLAELVCTALAAGVLGVAELEDAVFLLVVVKFA